MTPADPLAKSANSEEPADLMRRLLPGGASSTGFLAPGEHLGDVLARDQRALSAVGLTCEQVADKLDLVLGRAERRGALARRGRAVATSSSWLEVTGEHHAGFQECPFCNEDGRSERQPWASADYLLRDMQTGLEVRVAGLLPHLVRAHGFFEGNVPYRTDPTRLAQVLRLDPSCNEKPDWRTERVWTLLSWKKGVPWLGVGGPRRYWDAPLMTLLGQTTHIRRWDERVHLTPDVTACRVADWCVVFARGADSSLSGLSLDGSEFDMASAKGTVQFRRVDCRYVALEEPQRTA